MFENAEHENKNLYQGSLKSWKSFEMLSMTVWEAWEYSQGVNVSAEARILALDERMETPLCERSWQETLTQ